MNSIIRTEDTTEPPELPHTKIYGGKGSHAQDLLKRWLLISGKEWCGAHFVTLPISTIESAILELLLERQIPQWQIVSFSGVMTKSPNGVPAMHYLFGPWATKGLKVAVANTSPKYPPLVQSLLDQAQSKGIKIIETSRTEHDKKMAVIQWLMHLWLVLVWGRWSDDIKTSLIEPWKTPIQTIIDMIHANPFAEEAIKDFFDALPKYNHNINFALQAVVDKHLTCTDIENFWTPNSDRILQYLSRSGEWIVIPREEVERVRGALNTRGYTFLWQQVESIRSHQAS